MAAPRDPLRDFSHELAERESRRREAGLLRELAPPRGVDFSSNDYLGLSRHPRLRRDVLAFLETGPLGAPAARLLRGHLEEHRHAEEVFARFKNAEAALLFPSGYQANVGLLTALIGPHDRVLSDELNHASLIDGIRLSGGQKVIYPHASADAVELELRRPFAAGHTFVVTESLFSMDGDRAPLARLAAICRERGALLVVDEAHATGLFGPARGSGLLEEEDLENAVLATTSTCGKALGLSGAFITGSRQLVNHVLNHARSFVYTTAPLPLLAVAISSAIEIASQESWRRHRALRNAGRLRGALARHGVAVPDHDGPIVPVPVGDNHRAVAVAQHVQSQGFDVRALRPPTVPENTARLRVSVHADHEEDEIDGVARSLGEALASTTGSEGGGS